MERQRASHRRRRGRRRDRAARLPLDDGMGTTWQGSVLVGPNHVHALLFGPLRQMQPGSGHFENQQPVRRIADLRGDVDALLGTSAVLPHLVCCCHGTHPIRIHIPQQRQMFWKSGFRMTVPAAARVRDQASAARMERSEIRGHYPHQGERHRSGHAREPRGAVSLQCRLAAIPARSHHMDTDAFHALLGSVLIDRFGYKECMGG
jgi:hypothetical protein